MTVSLRDFVPPIMLRWLRLFVSDKPKPARACALEKSFETNPNRRIGQNVRMDGKVHQSHAPESIVTIGDDCWIDGLLYMATGSARLVVGCNSFIGPGASVTCADQIRIGDNVLIAQQAIIADTDNHSIYFEQRKNDLMQWREYKHDWSSHPSAPVIIEDGAWIGARCMILKGVTIGARAVIGAGSVVTKSIPADVIAAGNPARVIRKIAQ